MNFADKLEAQIKKTGSLICAGFDPRLEDFPKFILEGSIFSALTNFYSLALQAIEDKVACIKPNIAFFEQYGLEGLRAFVQICAEIRERGIPLIIDAKRGDIGSTAEAYAAAFLSGSKAFGKKTFLAEADALTISPFLGFDTVEVFIKAAADNGKGLFVLVKTSNPGSKALQETTSDKIAGWLAEKAGTLAGSSGLSGLGAVVGATYPDEARHLRKLMPTNYFLIPGLGSQGGSAADAVAGLTADKRGGVINVSRGLFGKDVSTTEEATKTKEAISMTLAQFNNSLNSIL